MAVRRRTDRRPSEAFQLQSRLTSSPPAPGGPRHLTPRFALPCCSSWRTARVTASAGHAIGRVAASTMRQRPPTSCSRGCDCVGDAAGSAAARGGHEAALPTGRVPALAPHLQLRPGFPPLVKDLRSGGSIELDGRMIQKRHLGHLSHGRWRRSRSRLSDGRGGLEVVSPLLVPR
jgi:hypothetical protein